MAIDTELTKEKVLALEEEALKKVSKDPWRLHFHLMPPSGWLNDPNGLSEVDGTNHIFFQYTPQDIKATTANCWGHYTTNDFINYTYLLPPLYPDTEHEKNGVYSGSAITTPNGINAYYTGNVKYIGDYDYINEGREQNLVLAEDYNRETGEFESKTLLMTNADYPEEMTLHVRDPKIIKGDGKLYMLLGARTKDNLGAAIVYESTDGKNWKEKEIIYGNKKLGYMWECPDGITIDGQDFLILSPQGIEPEGYKYQNKFQSGYLPIKKENEEIVYDDFIELDRGFDFYAPQTYIDEEGRTIMIGWLGMNNAEYDYPTKEMGWIHALTIPRVITQVDGKLIQSPVQELEALREESKTFVLTGTEEEIKTPKVYEFILTDPSETGEIIINRGCILKWNSSEFTMTFESEDQKIVLSGSGRTVRKCHIEKLENLRVYVDTSSIEVFINDGKEVFTTRYFPEEEKMLKIISNTKGNLTIFRLKAFTIERPDGTLVFDLDKTEL